MFTDGDDKLSGQISRIMDLAVNSLNAFPVVAFLIIALATLPIPIRESDDGDKNDGDETEGLALREILQLMWARPSLSRTV